MDGDPWANFLIWERASRDTIDFKTIYVDMANDLISGLLLSQIVYWYLPSKKGGSKLRVFKDGYYWIAKARHEWWDEIRVKTRQIDRAITKLEEKGIIVSRLFRFNNAPTTHIRIIKEGFLTAWDNALARFDETVKSEIPSDPFSPNRQFDFTDSSSGFNETVKSDLPESVQSITETTIDSTEITAENTGDFPENSKALTSKQMIQATADLFDEVGPETPEEIDAELRDAGYDPGEVGARMKAVADQAIIEQIIKQAETHPGPLDLARTTEEKQAEAGGNYAVPPSAGGADALADNLIAIYCQHMGEALPRGSEILSCRAAISKVLKVKGLQQNGPVAKLGLEILLNPEGEYRWYHDKYTLSVNNRLFIQHYGKVLSRLIAGGDGYSEKHKKGKSHAARQQIAPHAAPRRAHTPESAKPFIDAIRGRMPDL